MKPWYLLASWICLLGIPWTAFGQNERFKDVVTAITTNVTPTEAVPGQTVTVTFGLKLIPGWHTYPTHQVDPKASSQTNRFTFPTDGDIIFVGPFEDPATFITKPDVDLMVQEMRLYKSEVTWTRKAVISPKAKPGTLKIQIPGRLLVCDARRCLPPERMKFETSIEVKSGSQPIEAAYSEEVANFVSKAGNGTVTPPTTPPKNPPVVPPEVTPPTTPNGKPAAELPKVELPKNPQPLAAEDDATVLEKIRERLQFESEKGPNAGLTTSFWSLLITAAMWGWISLVTPCVFPMIPITVSIFLKKSEQSGGTPILQAVIYSLTIIIVLGTSAFTLLSVFRGLSVNPWMNLFLGCLFVFFALSLFGMYEITLPNFLTRFTGSREGAGGVIGTIFMALTFTIISFTCVAPFLGGFSGMVAQGNFSQFELLMAGLVFATAFASPFFVLALFPGMMKSLPRAGSWMNSVKVVMGFLEFAAAFKFFRTAELRFLPETAYFTYDVVLGAWITISLLCGLYLLNLYRLPHDDNPESIPVPRLLLGVVFVGLSFYLLPATFTTPAGERPRPTGVVYAWVDSFLLPETKKSGKDESITANLKTALTEAAAQRASTGTPQYVFVDFTGVTCTNCKYNEMAIFTRPEVSEQLKKFRMVQLYTDEIPVNLFEGSDPSLEKREAQALVNLNFQRKAFGSEQLPLYVILEPLPNGKIQVFGPYSEGKINDIPGFLKFLNQPFQKQATGVATR
ncbi:protein-disulfide reductase DsbD family protein [Tuwongella immobilis]|uniref:Thiol:disulfide interchange protein: Thiol:disulfide interchange protein n=1 Tax=Tuwongella immobilis TaxID=692036 RepID=A0A6C2YI86_9BACT|nr:cytochrome c biogenesis protein CcdA [Tuwongella immobilis]VIP00853.1 thiol:disulfide interchange protein : Thiol:disulfide interchange protein OS=Singulisphaera acidiphila (strain ATCC BAA-1392 / DSM 18658 / VKM B-2454 / MOB10) GN=Sinac_3167 PE=4 SV=1 [Tuwongella immobilis]VTR97124.1 thiol:disulfide interchange protein : Thiol:disulfide interchange protein OS=Singulisphaera acidiphila (strain ATCC BAA-1392 / DSM 18658 / VKM B-2454 / MOB10) GN=Sinac_3167 PE=4 SV=1 [Tuwongella immobilis]